jgi:carboxyl-terminal processing protease
MLPRDILQSDMDEFKKHYTKLDDYLNQGNLIFYKLTVDRLYQRVDDIDKMTQDIFSKPINLERRRRINHRTKKKNKSC